MRSLKVVPDAKGSVAREVGKPQRPAERSTRARLRSFLASVEAAPAPARVDHPILPRPPHTTAAIPPKVAAVLLAVVRRLTLDGRLRGRTHPGRPPFSLPGRSLSRLGAARNNDGPDLFTWPRRIP